MVINKTACAIIPAIASVIAGAMAFLDQTEAETKAAGMILIHQANRKERNHRNVVCVVSFPTVAHHNPFGLS